MKAWIRMGLVALFIGAVMLARANGVGGGKSDGGGERDKATPADGAKVAIGAKATGGRKFLLQFGFGMMPLGLVGAFIALVYPIFAIILNDIFAWGLPQYSVLDTILMAGGFFALSIMGGLICEIILKGIRREKRERD